MTVPGLQIVKYGTSVGEYMRHRPHVLPYSIVRRFALYSTVYAPEYRGLKVRQVRTRNYSLCRLMYCPTIFVGVRSALISSVMSSATADLLRRSRHARL